jgi:ABC-type transport system involved in multi-copper enzyme maturation permease subunit
MKNRIATIARHTVREAVRTRLGLLTVAVIAALFAASLFVREIAITESVRFQTVFYAATIRFAAVLIAALFAIASVVREFHDKGLEIALALDVPRSHYILGKIAGLLAIALGLSVAAGLPLLAMSGWETVLAWTCSLAFELAIVMAVSLFCVLTFNQLVPAFAFVVAFYVLARTLTAIRLIGANPVADATALSHRVMTWLMETLALIVPALDGWTRSAWLTGHSPAWTTLAAIAAHSVLLVVLLTAAAVFDMYRKNF